MIIKFKDTIHPNDEVFNRDLKGKYAHLIQGRYVMPLVPVDSYIDLERTTEWDKCYRNILYWHIDDLLAWIDDIETQNANSIDLYILHNQKSPDADLTMEQLRHARTNIASLMVWDTKNKDIWDYYRGGMYNEVIRQLMIYNKTSAPEEPGCGCSGATPRVFQPVKVCDPVEAYRNGIKHAMVTLVGDLEYWRGCPEVVIREICSYLKNLIKCGLVPSLKPSYKMLFSDGCSGKGHESYFKALDNALEAFRLILERSDRLNYITMGLKGFANVYELLEF